MIIDLFYWILRKLGLTPVPNDPDDQLEDSNSKKEDLLKTIDEMNPSSLELLGHIHRMNNSIQGANVNPGSKEKSILCCFRTYVNACVLTVIHSANIDIVNDALDRLSTMRARLNEQYQVIVGLIPSVDDCINRIVSLSEKVVVIKKTKMEKEESS